MQATPEERALPVARRQGEVEEAAAEEAAAEAAVVAAAG
jgi:hypothetical protein